MATHGFNRQTVLPEYADGELPRPPRVILDHGVTEAVRAPTDASKIAGHIGVDKHREGLSYVSRKVRSRHFYRKGGGYAISKGIITFLRNKGVQNLYFYEEGSRTCYEFRRTQFERDARPVKHAPRDDPQVVLALGDARAVWPNHGDPKLDYR